MTEGPRTLAPFGRRLLRVIKNERLGAYNMHGSLLPKYRGRVPVNWAVIRGERETGATLHRMVAKPDAGDMVAQHERLEEPARVGEVPFGRRGVGERLDRGIGVG